ncbi:YveK family protein [Paenibacillus aurantiacus]|uniref:YveK family protein n=1 Tax=Paenibacillus aurantiacus TaxID=1936118 RepID=A0ABV5L0E4_9BACL
MELKRYLQVIQKKLWLIALIVCCAVVLSVVKSVFFSTPVYEAEAKLIVNQTTQTEGQEEEPTINSVQTNIMLINTYKEILLTAAILGKVSEQYPQLEASAREISARTTVSAAAESQVMRLTYRDTSYKNAVMGVNGIAKVFQEQIPSIMKINNVTILNEASADEPAAPINYNPVMSVLLSFIVALIASVTLVFFIDYLDNTFKTEQELEEELGLPVLALITKNDKEDRKYRNNAKTSLMEEGKYATINQ